MPMVGKTDLQELTKHLKYATTRIDFEKLIQKGLLRKIGRSYYTDNVRGLPKAVRMKITAIAETKSGIRLTFSQSSKKAQKLYKKVKQRLANH